MSVGNNIARGDASRYRVRQGDTLSEIARRNQTTVATLVRLNGIQDANKIRADSTLLLPGAADGFDARGTSPRRGAPSSDGFDSSASTTVGRPPGTSASQNGYRDIADLEAFTRGGFNSKVAIVVGTAEGNRTPAGGVTENYHGHTDPGNAARNRGSFSYQRSDARNPQHADELWSRELAGAAPRYEAAARAAGLNPNNALLASTYFDLRTQSPRAAQNFLDRELPRLALDPRGMNRDALVDARVNAFRNDGGTLRAAGFNHSEARLRNDQLRRETALMTALDAQGYRDRGSAAPVSRPVARQPASVVASPERSVTARSSSLATPAPRTAPPRSSSSATPTNMNDTERVAASTDRLAVRTRTPWISQYNGQRVEQAGPTACFRAATAMARASGVTVKGPDHRFQLATAESANGIAVNRAVALQGRTYIDQQLAAGRPVVVGVNHQSQRDVGNPDHITDHFVVITGRGTDSQGRTFYSFHDPATQNASKGADTNANNRFYVDERTGGLTRPGPRTGYVVDRRFEVSMVRHNA